VKYIKSLSLRFYDHVERKQNQRMSKQIATTKTEKKDVKEEDHVKDGEMRLNSI
jgi:hypothetical protein